MSLKDALLLSLCRMNIQLFQKQPLLDFLTRSKEKVSVKIPIFVSCSVFYSHFWFNFATSVLGCAECQKYNWKLLKLCCPLLDREALTTQFCVYACVFVFFSAICLCGFKGGSWRQTHSHPSGAERTRCCKDC